MDLKITTYYYYFLLLLSIGCTPESQHGVTDQNQELSDLVRNPVRPDGTVDSSFLPVMTFVIKEFNFDTILQGDVVNKEFMFENTGTAPLLILKATSTCGCTIPEWPDHPIPPGKKGSIHVKFDSKNKEGRQKKEVTIFANTYPNHSHITIEGFVTKTK